MMNTRLTRLRNGKWRQSARDRCCLYNCCKTRRENISLMRSTVDIHQPFLAILFLNNDKYVTRWHQQRSVRMTASCKVHSQKKHKSGRKKQNVSVTHTQLQNTNVRAIQYRNDVADLGVQVDDAPASILC